MQKGWVTINGAHVLIGEGDEGGGGGKGTTLVAVGSQKQYDSLAKEHATSITAAQADTLLQYQGDGNQDINAYLRRATAADKRSVYGGQLQLKIGDIDAVMSQSSLNKSVETYRITHLPEKTYKVGSIIKDKGFVSTTMNEGVLPSVRENLYSWRAPDKLSIMKITAPKGTKAIFPSTYTKTIEHEQELLLDRNLKMKVTGISTMKLPSVVMGEPDSTMRVINMEVMK